MIGCQFIKSMSNLISKAIAFKCSFNFTDEKIIFYVSSLTKIFLYGIMQQSRSSFHARIEFFDLTIQKFANFYFVKLFGLSAFYLRLVFLFIYTGKVNNNYPHSSMFSHICFSSNKRSIRVKPLEERVTKKAEGSD